MRQRRSDLPQSPFISTIPPPTRRNPLPKPTSKLLLLFPDFLLGLKAACGVPIAEAARVHSLDADTRTTIAAAMGADVVAGVFFAAAPFIKSEVLAAHGEM